MRLQQFHPRPPNPRTTGTKPCAVIPAIPSVNTAMGITRYKQARYPEAEAFLRKALERPTDRFTTPAMPSLFTTWRSL